MKRGIELGINATLPSIQKAAQIANQSKIDYFFVPETNPAVMGVDAFDALEQISNGKCDMVLGTGIVNVFSRKKEEISLNANKIYQKTNENFVLGIGTSAPAIVEKLWNLKFEHPLSRLVDYTKYLRANFSGKIFWAAVGQKTMQLAAQNADGVIFFLKPRKQISSDIQKIKQIISSAGKSFDSFETICIVPTYVDSSENLNAAKATLAKYIGANEFYSNPLSEEFEKDVMEIRKTFKEFGLTKTIEKVSDDLVKEITICGTPTHCRQMLDDFQKETGCKTVIAGFDLPKEGFDSEFFENLRKLLAMM
ncbi:MAG: LLM class flavin-dependent oxidoreductase [Thaumarchaeota archaeon]|nr:LLM class flavin-dependent oxidoreductase [Nitrososphaerota archaeon]